MTVVNHIQLSPNYIPSNGSKRKAKTKALLLVHL